MILVLEIKGKGIYDKADSVTPHVFHTIDKANAFCKENTNLDSKYWTNAIVVDTEECIELFHPDAS